MHPRDFSYVWELDRGNELSGRTLWWWWWNFYFSDPAKSDEPKQLLLIWATRNCEKLKLNDLLWMHGGDEKREGSATYASGINVGAYYDGARMHTPLILANGKLNLNHGSSTAGSLEFGDLNVRTRYEGNAERGRVLVQGRGFEMSISVEP